MIGFVIDSFGQIKSPIQLTCEGMDIIEELRAQELSYHAGEMGAIRIRKVNDSQDLFIRPFKEKTPAT